MTSLSHFAANKQQIVLGEAIGHNWMSIKSKHCTIFSTEDLGNGLRAELRLNRLRC